MSKNLIRKKILKVRKKFNSQNIPFKSKKILEFVKTIKLKKKVIGCYYPINYEANIIELIYKLQNNNYLVGLPIMSKNFDMNFYEFKINDPLYVNKIGIPEPTKKKKLLPNILFIPIVAFDKNLNRIGYGGGYYDRFINKMNSKSLVKIGIALSCQKVKQIPTNKFDKKLDYIFTEKELF